MERDYQRARRIPRKSETGRAFSVLIRLAAALAFAASAHAQTILHGQVLNGPGGPSIGLFEINGGTLTSLSTGLPSNNFPSVSADGRFVTLSSGDPAFPNEASDDLWEYDRATGQTRKIIDNETTTQPDGSIFFSSPIFSARSPDNTLVAVATQLGAVPGGGLPQTVNVFRASDGFEIGLAEIGQGGALDLTRGEFLGITWRPDGSAFATPAYLNVTTNTGRASAAIGIVLYAFNPATLNYGRIGALTIPSVTDLPGAIIQENHAFPVLSPNGQRLAFFSITFPSALLQAPVTARLHTVDTNGANLSTLVQFSPGLFPTGLSWSPDASTLYFSVANQASGGGQFNPFGLPETAILRQIGSFGGTPSAIPGAPFGFLPSAVPEPAFGTSALLGCAAMASLASRRRGGRTR